MSWNKSKYVEDLYDVHALPLLKYLKARFSSEEASEVAQEAWLRMYRLDNPESLRNPRAFLFQTASNLAIDRLRRSQLEQRHQEREVVPEESPSMETTVDARESLAIVEAAMHELPENCRQAFLLHRTRDLSYPEIAEALGVSTSMVEKYIIQALKHFRNKLAQ